MIEVVFGPMLIVRCPIPPVHSMSLINQRFGQNSCRRGSIRSLRWGLYPDREFKPIIPALKTTRGNCSEVLRRDSGRDKAAATGGFGKPETRGCDRQNSTRNEALWYFRGRTGRAVDTQGCGGSKSDGGRKKGSGLEARCENAGYLRRVTGGQAPHACGCRFQPLGRERDQATQQDKAGGEGGGGLDRKAAAKVSRSQNRRHLERPRAAASVDQGRERPLGLSHRSRRRTCCTQTGDDAKTPSQGGSHIEGHGSKGCFLTPAEKQEPGGLALCPFPRLQRAKSTKTLRHQ
ncbi:hypothetical protein R52603_00718 [Paraburkholderia saeva]|uniref:Uncharacterized protein n=1 Tax=Paraburkholderia saeva TaxID=2777537 RepID=A0A9N8RVW2_9BURK|nr:hypothetical protein R52603_00718 [Paraburkholderia saeva]CAG4895958.1 hypothetical protein LMG31841_02263 [Paraburkholderia saeva]